MSSYFGTPQPRTVLLDASEPSATPVGESCAYCGESFDAAADGYILDDGRMFHNCCYLAGILEVQADPVPDITGMTVCQAADATVQAWLAQVPEGPTVWAELEGN